MSYWKVEPKGQFQGQTGAFLYSFNSKSQFSLYESKLFHQSTKYPKNTLHLRSEVRQIMKIGLFFIKPLITLTCNNSLINPVTTKFYSAILIKVANETGCQSLIDQWRQNLFERTTLNNVMVDWSIHSKKIEILRNPEMHVWHNRLTLTLTLPVRSIWYPHLLRRGRLSPPPPPPPPPPTNDLENSRLYILPTLTDYQDYLWEIKNW